MSQLVTQKQAHDLAVRYAAYLEAVTADRPNANRISVWGKMLLRSQRETGIELISDQTIEQTLAIYEKAA